MANIMKTVTVSGQEEGKLFEEFVKDFLMFRLLVLSSTSMPVRASISNRPFCIGDLLSIPREGNFRLLPDAIQSKLDKEVGEVHISRGIKKHHMKNKLCSYGSIPNAWLDEIQSVLSGRKQFYVIKGHPDDAFDCLLVYYPEGEDPYFYFIETKSNDLSIIGTKACEGEEKVSRQYKIVNDTIGRLFPVSTNLVNERNSPSAPYTAVRRALQNRQFLYIYLTTHPQPFSHKEDCCVVLGDRETKRFLSFAYDVYRTARTTNSKDCT
jgi:hypothetical protein